MTFTIYDFRLTTWLGREGALAVGERQHADIRLRQDFGATGDVALPVTGTREMTKRRACKRLNIKGRRALSGFVGPLNFKKLIKSRHIYDLRMTIYASTARVMNSDGLDGFGLKGGVPAGLLLRQGFGAPGQIRALVAKIWSNQGESK